MAGRKAFYGIDLGTTHTVVVKATKEGGEWKYVKLKLVNMPISELDDIKETELLPSAVYFAKDGRIIVGEYAKEAIHFDPERVYINAKIDLGGSLRKDQYNEHTPQEVSKEILKVCFAKIVEDGGSNASVRISVPAAFSQDKRSDTENAAKQALFELGYKDLKLVRTTEEPFAALVNLVVNENQFINMVQSNKNTIMLIDIGGGTMDIIISDISQDKANNVLKASTPYEPAKHDEFAGAKFDYEMMKKFMADFLNHYELYEHEVPEQDLIILEKRMLLITEDAKKFLCNKENASRTYEFTCDFEGLRIDLSQKEPFKISISKKQMDIALDGLLNSKEEYGTNQSIKRIIRKTLSDNGLSPKDIDCIYLTGGMANYDQISNTIKSVIQKPVIVAKEPLYCTAIGVALSLVIQTPEGTAEISKALQKKMSTRNNDEETEIITREFETEKQEEIISGANIDISETKRMGMSYYIDVEDKMPVEIISKDESYPCLLKNSNVKLKTSSQSRMNLVLYEGRSVYDCGMRLLRKKTVEFSEMVNIGTTIDISYKIDANKLITIYASVDGEAPFEFNTEED
ncbi:chaperone protein DnaK [Leptotrichia trevisanii]|jgi:heat shock protein 70|uniref:Chaperone protein DnaK n=1 Tax=Leptotrichia trevisanii TaxID=109328 RepID=A0A510KM00_9FUSO|nr:Hsp70 family protein [Leptotrichia trevisanii]BBM52728.1 chaperone protein DnaK [Leptotrichia trevisanii]